MKKEYTELNLIQQQFTEHVSYVMHCIQHKGLCIQHNGLCIQHNDGKWSESFSSEYLNFVRINCNF